MAAEGGTSSQSAEPGEPMAPAGEAERAEPGPAGAAGAEAARPRGRVSFYALAFALVLSSAASLYYGNMGSSLKLVWTSMGLSTLAALVAVASLIARRK